MYLSDVGENWNRTVAAVVLAAVAVAAGAGFGMLRRGPPARSPSPTQPSANATSVSGVDVHVAGWVNRPGVVTVPDGSIVADAVAAAGGMKAGATAEAINLAAPVSDGQQVVVPGPDSMAGPGGSGESGGLISLSRASESKLETLPGVGPVLAERIVAHRETQGPFERVEDLLEVPGIGEAKLASLRDLVQP